MRIPICTTALLLALAASLCGQQPAERPAAKLFGFGPAKTVPGPAPELRESTNRLLEILVELAWLDDPMVFPFFCDARVEGANLKVRGNLPSPAVRDRALQLAKANCPLPVIDNLKVNPNLSFHPQRATPEQLQNLARASLREVLPKQAKRLVTRSAADGRIVVSGTVDSFEDKLLISQAMRRLHHCTVVGNMVKVAADPDGQLAKSLAHSSLPPATAPDKSPPATVVDGQLTAREKNPLIVEPADVGPPAKPRPVVPSATPEPAAAPTAKSIEVSALDLPQLKKQLEQVCPTAKEIRVSTTPAGEAKVEIEARTTTEGSQMLDRARTIPELEAMRLSGNLELEVYSPP